MRSESPRHSTTPVTVSGCLPDENDEVTEPFGETIANVSKGRKAFSLTAFDGCWIREAPVYPSRVAWKDRTALVRVVADGDDVVEGLTVEFTNMFRAMEG